MSVTAVETTRSERVDRAASTEPTGDLRRLQRIMLERASRAGTKLEVLRSLAELLHRHSQPDGVFYFGRNEQGELDDAISLSPETSDQPATPPDRMAAQLKAFAKAACRQGEIDVRSQVVPPRLVITSPIPIRGSTPEAVSVVFSRAESDPYLIMLLQMLTSHVVLWQVLVQTPQQRPDDGVDDSAALIDLVSRITGANNVRHACYTLAAELQSHLKCRRVAVGLRRRQTGPCRLAAISGVAKFDRRSQTARALEAVFDEVLLRDDVILWPPSGEEPRHAALAHKNLCATDDARHVVSTPLRCEDGTAIGALVLLDVDAAGSLDSVKHFVRAAEGPVATSLDAVRKIEGGRLSRWGRAIRRGWRSWTVLGAAVAVVLLIAVMAMPFSYKISSDCQIEPATRRYVAAPFQGTLEKSLVKPGEIVHAGDVLARMDGREIRWERASLVADRNQAIKKRDAAQAAHKYSEAQIAQLEMERLDLQLQLLDDRAEHLEIKSPVDGIVASGDLERAEGAPLTVGQTLFEIAPLQTMIAEVAVPDDEVSFVQEGQPIAVRLDAYPDETWHAVLKKIHPRSEIRDDANVFIAEAELDNTDGRLRPGMKGRAKITTPDRPLAWNLFHEPLEYVAKTVNW